MVRFSNDKKINEIVKDCLKKGWTYRRGKKHDVLIAPNNRRMAIPGTPGDGRAFKNFARDVLAIVESRYYVS